MTPALFSLEETVVTVFGRAIPGQAAPELLKQVVPVFVSVRSRILSQAVTVFYGLRTVGERPRAEVVVNAGTRTWRIGNTRKKLSSGPLARQKACNREYLTVLNNWLRSLV